MDRRLPLRQLAGVSFAIIGGCTGTSLGRSLSAALLLLLAFTPASAGEGPPYPSSVVGTDFDFITTDHQLSKRAGGFATGAARPSELFTLAGDVATDFPLHQASYYRF